MAENTKIILFTSFMAILFFGMIVWISVAIWRERQKLKLSWKQLNTFQKWSIKFGLMIFFFMPILSHHPAKDSYLPKVLSELLYETGKALFIFGMISLLQYLLPEEKAKNDQQPAADGQAAAP